MFTLLLASAAALTGLVSAQNYSTQNGALYVDPNSVDLDLRRSWCTGQTNTCPFVCAGPDANPGDAFPNNCDPNTLTYECTCANGNSPNMSAYTETLPFFICGRWRDDCTAAHPNDLAGQTACQSVTCGTRNATAGASSSGGSASGSASASASSTPTSSSSGSGSSESASTSSDAAQSSSTDNAAATIGMQYGTGILAAGLMAAFGLAL